MAVDGGAGNHLPVLARLAFFGMDDLFIVLIQTLVISCGVDVAPQVTEFDLPVGEPELFLNLLRNLACYFLSFFCLPPSRVEQGEESARS